MIVAKLSKTRARLQDALRDDMALATDRTGNILVQLLIGLLTKTGLPAAKTYLLRPPGTPTGHIQNGPVWRDVLRVAFIVPQQAGRT
jgi:hypothetical protein